MKFLLLLLLSVAILSPIAQSHAYGGGGGFPPSYFGSPVHIECRYEQRAVGHLTFQVRKCEAVRDHDFRDRVRAFVERLRHGGYNN